MPNNPSGPNGPTGVPPAPKLKTQTVEELFNTSYEPLSWLVEDLVLDGLVLLCGAPKSGKSWLALQLATAVSTGTEFLGHPCEEADVLCLFLEDRPARVARRLDALGADAHNERMHVACQAERLDTGLVYELDAFVDAHPQTRLVVVDTLQLIRPGVFGEKNPYASDYKDMAQLKEFADRHGLALLAVHHTRKMHDENPFNMVLGTNGISGAADEVLLLTKQNHLDAFATLSTTGRDIDEPSEYRLAREGARWEVVERTGSRELMERSVPPAIVTVADRFDALEGDEWSGTVTALLTDAGIDGIPPTALGRQLSENRWYLARRGIELAWKRTAAARSVVLRRTKTESSDS